MFSNFKKPTPRNSTTSSDSQSSSLFFNIKRFEYTETLAFLEKSMLFLSNPDKKVLRRELKTGNHKLEFILLKHKKNIDKGLLSLELKNFLKEFKGKSIGLKNDNIKKNSKTAVKEVISPKKTQIFLENCENYNIPRLFLSERKILSPKQVLGNSNDNQKNMADFLQTPKELSTKISDFSEIISVFESPKKKTFSFCIYKDKLKDKLIKEVDFIKDLPLFLQIDDPELLIRTLFSEKGLHKISSAYFRLQMQKFLRPGLEDMEKKVFLNKLFAICDLKNDGLLDINEVGLAFELIFTNAMKHNSQIKKIWEYLDEEKKNFVFTHEIIGKNKNFCNFDVDKKGFLTYWDLFLQEIQERDLAGIL